MIERIEINLLPAEYRVHRKQFKIKREVAYPLFAAGLIAAGLSFFTFSLQNSNRIAKNEIKSLQQSIEQNRPIQNEINNLRRGKQAIEQKIRALELINVNREKWVRLMEEFSNRLPEYTWLVNLKEESREPPVIHIEGRTYSFPDVANYMSNLKECAYVKTVDLSEIEQISPKDRIFKFSISCALNPDAYLPAGSSTSTKAGPR
jgi:Tfp pilus assembly protein PilN